MSKTIKREFDKKLTFEKMLQAHERAKKHKTTKGEVIRFEIDLENNITTLINNIKNETYKTGKYHVFTVYEPKERIIKALPYRDRIVHQWYVEEFIKPYFLKRFIIDTYACIENRGTHNAVLKTQKYMRIMKRKYNNYYILKCDVRKYFYTIDKQILFDILKKYISDKKLLNFTQVLLDDEEKLGIPIGNYTSQFFANIYLNELDQYIKKDLKIKYYIRYMDDFIIMCQTKEEAKVLKEKINNFIIKNLNLKLNQKTNYYPNKMGVNFCGYRIYETHILLRERCKKKINKNIKKWNKLYQQDDFDILKVRSQFNSWLAHSKHADSYKFRNKVLNKLEFKKELLDLGVEIDK